MNKQAIIQALEKQYAAFIAELEAIHDKEFEQAPEGKWSAGQQLDHLCRSVQPLALGLRLPTFVLKLVFKKANRPSKSYEELVSKYLGKIADGGKASGAYIPARVDVSRKAALLAKLKKQTATLCHAVNGFAEADLDKIVLPHPLIGQLTLREMLYFTIYHAEHHRQSVLRNLASK